METKVYNIADPILDKAEEGDLIKLKIAYDKMVEPKAMSKMAAKVGDIIPDGMKQAAKKAKDGLTEQAIFVKSMEYLGKSFSQLEKVAAKSTLSTNEIIKRINALVPDNDITTLDEICLAKEYTIYDLVNKYKNADLAATVVEGGALGAAGFVGLLPNLVLSTFLYYRAVQSVALFYGYDVKNNPDELQIAGEVFTNAISPRNNTDSELSSVMAKVMLITEATTIKQTVKKGWSAMASKDTVTLLLTQMRALAHASAKKALEKAGKKGLEESAFKNVFEQIGKSLAQKNIGKAVPIFGAFVGATLDTVQMQKIIDYANIFYAKRFILEKQERIIALTGDEPTEIIVAAEG